MSLDLLFKPSSIAVVGASRNEEKVGNIVVQNLLQGGYEGDIYPINPFAKEIAGLPVYGSIKKTPQLPDLTILAIPVGRVIEAFTECCEHGCKQFVVFTAGFKEAGEKGEAIEKELTTLAQQYQVSLLGPNCLGFVHTERKVNATFADVAFQKGNAHIISQSGAIASAFFDWSEAVDLGFADCVTLGNKASVTELDLLEYWAEKNGHGPVGLYLEQISDGQRFLELTSDISSQQPVLLLKPGKSASAQAAMQSHTGSIAGEDAVLQAACDQAGIIRCHTIQDMFEGLMYFSWEKAPTGNRIAIVSNAGGPGVVASDLIDDAGLQVAELSETTKRMLINKLPRAAGINNPIDVLGDAKADRYRDALEAIIEDKADVDMILVILTPQVMTEITETAQVIAELAEVHDMPIACAFIGETHVEAGQKILYQHNIPCFSYPTSAIRILAKAYHRHSYVERQKLTTQAHIQTSTSVTLPEAIGPVQDTLLEEMLEQVGISIPPATSLASREDALAWVEQYGYPIVAKLSSPELLHKYEHKALVTHIMNTEELKLAYTQLANTREKLLKNGFTNVQLRLQQQIEGGVELIVGYKYDPNFGKVLLFGPGGTLTELFHDHHMVVLPVGEYGLEKMIHTSSIAPLLDGFRGRPAANKEALLDLLIKVVQIVQSTDRIDQFEINPIIINEQDAYAVDPKMILKE